MPPQGPKTLHAAEQAVRRLVKECSKQGTLYPRSPRAVAQVSRTGKWLLSALAALERALGAASTAEDPRAG
jgi:hypothetical protein